MFQLINDKEGKADPEERKQWWMESGIIVAAVGIVGAIFWYLFRGT